MSPHVRLAVVLSRAVLLPFAASAALLGGVVAWSLDTGLDSTGARVAAALAGAVALALLTALGGWALARVQRDPPVPAGPAPTIADGTAAQRDGVRNNLAMLGETLSSTLDLDRIVGVIVETAMASVQAQGGLLMLATAGRTGLYAAATRGLTGPLSPATTAQDGRPVRLTTGEGVLGTVFGNGEALLLTAPIHDPPPSAHEPVADSVLAVPLRSAGAVIGVLGLYTTQGRRPFDRADLDVVRTFAAQAGVAIDNVMLHEEAQRLSITDGLTGLWNYRYLLMAVNREVERATRFRRPLAVLMIDIDHFKLINDTHGHQRGDSVLVELATRLKSRLREVDVPARYGGEEFACVLPETDLEGGRVLAESIRDAVRCAPFEGTTAGEPDLSVTISIGVAAFPGHGPGGTEILRAADEALYVAKREGRDAVRLAVPAGEESLPEPESRRRDAQ